MNIAVVPEGYMKNAQGHLIPIDKVKPLDKARDDFVKEIIAKARPVQDAMAEFKQQTFEDFAAFVSLSAEEYGANVGGTKGNITLHSFCGKYKVMRNYQDHLNFDERLQAAKVLIDECLHEWTQGSRSEVQAIINQAFSVDREGKISTSRVLGLKRLDITDPKWLKAMQAISDSVTVTDTKAYIRLYERDDTTGQYQQISLDMASI